MYVGMYIVETLTKEMEDVSPEELESFDDIGTMVLATMILLIPAIALIFIKIGTGESSIETNEGYVDTENIALEPSRSGENPKEILQKRFVNGEISNEEYTEKMARL